MNLSLRDKCTSTINKEFGNLEFCYLLLKSTKPQSVTEFISNDGSLFYMGEGASGKSF